VRRDIFNIYFKIINSKKIFTARCIKPKLIIGVFFYLEERKSDPSGSKGVGPTSMPRVSIVNALSTKLIVKQLEPCHV